MNSKAKKTVTAAMLAALCCVATMLIKIPSPLNGYVNMGDCIVLLAGFVLSPPYSFLAAATGSLLADIFSGFALYAPATFIIKGIMALVAGFSFKLFKRTLPDIAAGIISGAIAETVMVFGYFVFEGILYGFITAAVNIPANVCQGVICLVLGVLITEFFNKHQILK